MASDEYLEQTYQLMRTELEDKIPEFEFIVTDLVDVGEPEAGLHNGLGTAVMLGIPLSDELLNRLEPIMVGEKQRTYDLAVEGRTTP